MSDSVAIAFGARSPLGYGKDALPWLHPGEAPRVVVRDDPELRRAGLTRCAAARTRMEHPRTAYAAHLCLEGSMRDCLDELTSVLPAWRQLRVGVALGTSSGAMPALEAALESLAKTQMLDPELARASAYAAPFEEALAQLGVVPIRSVHVLAACASSTIALGVGHLWLQLGVCDVVLAGGYDVLTTFVASGFTALGAVTLGSPQPFRLRRDGLALGEGSVVIALTRSGQTAASAVPSLCIAGFGASTDAMHITAPDRTGAGVVRAASQALERAGVHASQIDLISAHGTATLFNDAAEAQAIATLLGPRRDEVPVHAMKGEVGHLLGAAGALETLALGQSLQQGVALASAGTGELDPKAQVRILDRTLVHPAQIGLKLSSAFGGANAALVLRAGLLSREGLSPLPSAGLGVRGTGDDSKTKQDRDAPLVRRGFDELAARTGISLERVARMDDLTRLVIDAIADLADHVGREAIARAGLVVGHDVATLATNALFYQRVLARGPRAAEPRRFPFTSPNACVGEAAIAFGIKQISLAVGGGSGLQTQALALAHDLLAAGFVDAMVVVEVTECSALGDAMLIASGHKRRAAFSSFATARWITRLNALGYKP